MLEKLGLVEAFRVTLVLPASAAPALLISGLEGWWYSLLVSDEHSRYPYITCILALPYSVLRTTLGSWQGQE